MSDPNSSDEPESARLDETRLATVEVIEERVEVVAESPEPAASPPVRLFEAQSIEERVQVVSEHSLPVRAWLLSCSIAEWLFGLACLLVGLAALAAIPLLQFVSLGYLLEASGRIARTGQVRAGFIDIRKMARIGSLVAGTWLMLLPLRLLADFWYSAQLMAPQGGPTVFLRVSLLVLTVLFIGQ